MSLHISFELSQSDLDYFCGIMSAARAKASSVTQQQVIENTARLLAQVRQSDTADFIRDRMTQLETLTGMLADKGWGLSDEDRERVITALSYFYEPEDLIPDDTPGLGFFDDAVMIEIVCKELEHEIQAYKEFVAYRAAEIKKREEHYKEPHKADWLETRRQQLHSRMRRRRKGQRDGKQTKPPFSLH